MTPVACATVDLDPLPCYLQARGLPLPAGTSSHVVIRDALPRFLEELDACGIRATFFAVGAEAAHESNAVVLREAVARGHEIANHSLTHPLHLGRLAPAALRAEIAESARLLETATGKPVHGFRAPGWNVSRRLFAVLEALGVHYDASLVPLPFPATLAGLANRLPGTPPHGILHGQRAWPGPPRHPYRVDLLHPWRPGSARLREVPGGAAGPWPVPLTTTALVPFGARASAALLRAAALGTGPVVFVFHGIDLLDPRHCSGQPGLAAKPGMLDSLDVKRDRFRRIVDLLGRKRRWIRMCELAGSGCQAHAT